MSINKKIIIITSLCFLSACATIENSAFSPLYFGPNNISVGEAKLKVRQYMRSNISESNIPSQRVACDSLGIYGLNVKPDNYPYNSCIKDADGYYNELRSEITSKNEAKKQQELKKQEEEYADQQKNEENKKALKVVEEKALEVDIKSGNKKPTNFKEYMVLYSATDGTELASAPKIKPDSSFYAITGTINTDNEDNSFLARLYTGISAVDIIPSYFSVKIPADLKEKYYSTARINAPFIIIGSYIDNQQYNTAYGQSKSMPVFAAVYFKMLK